MDGNDGHQPDCAGYEDCRCFPTAEDIKIKGQQAAIRELVEALRKYGRHDAGCMYYHHGKDGPCTCGLDALVGKYGEDKA
jgi:hypothetical protein